MPLDSFDSFLAGTEWAEAVRRPLAGDASNRRYLRLTRADGATAVLMDAPPARGEDITQFVRIARHLTGLGLSAPRIYAEDATRGLCLLEDLGDALFARLLRTAPAREDTLYAAAVDVLVQLHDHPALAGLPAYGSTTMPELGALALDWYVHGGDRAAAPDDRATLTDLLGQALAPFDAPPRVLVQRDYHAENLLWLPERDGAARVGLLDFQDAAAGHPAYDLASLTRDARRDVSPTTAMAAEARYAAARGIEPEKLRSACATMAVQRNLRILGVFARLSLHFGKPAYVDLIPRVWGHLERDLHHPALSDLAVFVARHLPPPEPTRLQDLKNRCATVPTL